MYAIFAVSRVFGRASKSPFPHKRRSAARTFGSRCAGSAQKSKFLSLSPSEARFLLLGCRAPPPRARRPLPPPRARRPLPPPRARRPLPPPRARRPLPPSATAACVCGPLRAPTSPVRRPLPPLRARRPPSPSARNCMPSASAPASGHSRSTRGCRRGNARRISRRCGVGASSPWRGRRRASPGWPSIHGR